VTSKVSAVSGIVAKGHQTMQHVSSSPSKIPYVEFSPIRLKTGIQLQPSPTEYEIKRKTRMPSSRLTYTQLKLSALQGVFPGFPVLP